MWQEGFGLDPGKNCQTGRLGKGVMICAYLGWCTLLQTSCSIQLHSPTMRYIQRRRLHCFALQSHHAVRKFALRACCRNGTGLTSCLPKRTGSATTYPGQMGRRSLTSFSDLLALQSALMSSTCSPDRAPGLQRLREGPRRARGKRGLCQGWPSQHLVVPSITTASPSIRGPPPFSLICCTLLASSLQYSPG